MRLLPLLLLVLIPYWCSAASSCSGYKSCVDCSGALDTDGEQLCSWCVTNGQCVPKSGLECVFGTKISDQDECPIPIPNGYGYNETLAHKMLLLSFSSYGNSAQTCIDKYPMIKDVKVTKQIEVDCDKTETNTCSGYTAVSKLEKAIILCSRGSNGTMQLMTQAEYSVFKEKQKVPGGGSVSKYFYDGYNALWSSGLKDALSSLIKKYSGYELWVTGHSMGGAFATVAANVIAAEKMFPVKKIKIITFGQPRVGNSDFASAYDDMFLFKYRIVHKHDLVPHVPPKNFLDYKHHRYEVWYANNMTEGSEYKICLTRDGNSCSNKNLMDLSTTDHKYYFNHFIDDFRDNTCSSK